MSDLSAPVKGRMVLQEMNKMVIPAIIKQMFANFIRIYYLYLTPKLIKI
jgi:hypothetical protein